MGSGKECKEESSARELEIRNRERKVIESETDCEKD